MIFLDTNVLLYSLSDTPADAARCRIACSLLDRTDVALSTHVLQEFFHQATRPTRPAPLPDDLAIELIKGWLRFPVQVIGVDEIQHALAIRQRYKFSYWDSAIIAAALTLGCNTLMSEDLQHGFAIEGLRIRNPFLNA